MNTILLSIIIAFLSINLISFLIMLIDKEKSKQNGSTRVSEGMMFFMAAALGSIGVYAGMFAFRHKTRKWYFLAGIPFMIVQNSAFLYLTYLFWFS